MLEKRNIYHRAGCTALMRGNIHSQSPLTGSVPVGSEKRVGNATDLQGICNSILWINPRIVGGNATES